MDLYFHKLWIKVEPYASRLYAGLKARMLDESGGYGRGYGQAAGEEDIFRD